MVLFAIKLAMGLGAMASPAAAPFAYVTTNDRTVTVIDTATNSGKTHWGQVFRSAASTILALEVCGAEKRCRFQWSGESVR
jgi:hypothetical protein